MGLRKRLLRRSKLVIGCRWLSNVPESEVEDTELRQFHDALQSRRGDLGAAVQIDTAEVAQMIGHGGDGPVRDATALPDVERLQVRQ